MHQGRGADTDIDTDTGVADGCEVWLVRHGETEWSLAGKHTSVTNLPLTARGERQATALRAVLAGVDPALVLCSPRARAQDTAKLAGLAVDGIDDDLAEWNYGEYEGRTSAEIRAEVPGWTLFRDGVPGGESADDVAMRADRVLSRVREATADGPVVLIGHGHLSRVLGARWIGLPASGAANLLLDTAAICLLSAQYGVPVLKKWNLTAPADDLNNQNEGDR